jgi:hypothetical protein
LPAPWLPGEGLPFGRRTLVLLGLPVLTADYVYWLAIDDIRRSSPCALENDERVDVLVARSVPTVDGRQVEFETLWSRRRPIGFRDDVEVLLPILENLILTNQIHPRPKHLEDVRRAYARWQPNSHVDR